MKLSYNARLDTLYAHLVDHPHHSYGDDETPGIIVLRERETDEPTGFTVIGLRHKMKTHALPPLPAGLSWERDVLPNVRFHA
jgi:hypothetical protein